MLSSKGQVVLPKEIRAKRGWSAGTELEVEDTPTGVLLRVVRNIGDAALDDLLGCAGYSGPKKTLEDMEAGIEAGARARR